MSPAETDRSMPSTALTEPKCLARLVTFSAGSVTSLIVLAWDRLWRAEQLRAEDGGVDGEPLGGLAGVVAGDLRRPLGRWLRHGAGGGPRPALVAPVRVRCPPAAPTLGKSGDGLIG